MIGGSKEQTNRELGNIVMERWRNAETKNEKVGIDEDLNGQKDIVTNQWNEGV